MEIIDYPTEIGTAIEHKSDLLILPGLFCDPEQDPRTARIK
jgi:hypothetical protein